MKFKPIAGLLAVTLWLAAAPAFAQTVSSPATLTGIAVDSTGLALPGVAVTLTVDSPPLKASRLFKPQTAAGASHSMRFQPGRYALVFLLPGFSGEADGFSSYRWWRT